MKRATRRCAAATQRTTISIHALVKRATGIAGHDEYNTCDFNPRPREEGDYIFYRGSQRFYISIHALVKRATPGPFDTNVSEGISIHALVKRATVRQDFIKAIVYPFQSTPS